MNNCQLCDNPQELDSQFLKGIKEGKKKLAKEIEIWIIEFWDDGEDLTIFRESLLRILKLEATK